MIYTVLTAHSFSIAVLASLMGVVAFKQTKGPTERALLFMLFSFVAWITGDAFSQYYQHRNAPVAWIGSLAGIAVQLVALSCFVFCEYFPAGRKGPRTRLRITVVIAGFLICSPLTFHPAWISNRRIEDGVIQSDLGPLFVVVSIWAMLVVISGLGLVAYRYRTLKDSRHRLHTKLFLYGAALSFLFTVVFAFFLPLVGLNEYFFLGPDACLLVVGLMAYAILNHQMFDLRTAALRMFVKVLFSVASAAAVYALFVGLFIFDRGWAELSPAMFILLSLLFLAGMQFGRMVLPRIDQLLFRRWPSSEEILLSILDRQELRAGVATYHVLANILTRLRDAVGFDKGFILTTDALGKPLAFSLGRIPPGAETAARSILVRLLTIQSWPEKALSVFDRVLVLDDGGGAFAGTKTLLGRYPRAGGLMGELIEHYRQLGLALIMPLVYKDQITAFLVLGERPGGIPYFSTNVKTLNALRVSLALALKNGKYYEEIQNLKVRAEAEAEKLTAAITAKEVTETSIDDKTLVYQSAKIAGVVEKVNQAAAFMRPILLFGETGTGKELFARLIHNRGETKSGPFVAVNCAAIPETIWEDEIFGHKKGAFTDARKDYAGKVRQAKGGTLFFDEIGEMPAAMQAKMLRLLQENTYQPLGSEKPEKADCRFIFATNRNLLDMIGAGTFREDLYYRINVFQIDLPPLRHRSEDIPPLMEHFLLKFSNELKIPVRDISPQAMQALVKYPWPGNIRELENTLLRAMAGAQDSVLRLEDFPIDHSMSGGPGPVSGRSLASLGASAGMPGLHFGGVTRMEDPGGYEEKMQAYQKMLIERALDLSQGNRTRAAEMLGIKRGKLLYQMKELGMR